MTRTLLSTPVRRPLVAPSVLAADFAHLAAACSRAIEAGADLLHVDVMDGHFVPNLTMGPDICAALRRELPEVTLDVHLMVTDPADFIEPFARAGADHISVHIESNGDPRTLADAIHAAGCTAGLAINPPTLWTDAYAAALADYEMALVMSVNPGFGGQAFMPEVLGKVSAARDVLGADGWVEMDGGVGPATAAACRAAGCDVLVAGSAIFRADDWPAAVTAVRGAVSSVAGAS